MIIVCEPQCKGISHEKVNSGFIYGLRLAYPKEKITFFADTSHFKELKNIFKSNSVSIKDLKHIPISFSADKSFSIGGIILYYLLFRKIFGQLLSLGTNKLFFLSTSPIILFTIKKLKQLKKYEDICCTFVLHGELEDIANANHKEPYISVIESKPAPLNFREAMVKLLKHRDKIPLFISEKLSQPFSRLYLAYTLIFKKIFRVKKMMMWQHSSQYKYISLSPHVTENAKKYIDTDYLNFRTIILPIIFAKPTSPTNNKFIKFAVFGYGDSAQMHKMLSLLSKKQISKPYEIRIISMDSRGTEGFPNVRILSQGKVLTRKKMENSLPDIDVFINLYDINRHRFGCSLSILEAFSYLKPVLHLSNPGYNYFNKPEKPIGFRVDNLNEFVVKMYDMIENFPRYKNNLAIFRENMLEYRKVYAIENSLDSLRKSFTF